MDISQGILIGVISLLTLVLLFIGWQVFLLILDFRKTLKRANKIVDDIGVGVTSEILRIAFSGQKERRQPPKIVQKTARQVELAEPDTSTNGHTNGGTNGEHEKVSGFHLELKAPRFFRGLPKRR